MKIIRNLLEKDLNLPEKTLNSEKAYLMELIDKVCAVLRVFL